MRIAQTRFSIENMRRSVLYAALTLYVFGISATAGERFGQWSHLKVREAEGFKSVHFYFLNDLDAKTPTTNHVVIDLPGFSSGLETFKKKCEGAQ
jgi:hypothetical protein